MLGAAGKRGGKGRRKRRRKDEGKKREGRGRDERGGGEERNVQVHVHTVGTCTCTCTYGTGEMLGSVVLWESTCTCTCELVLHVCMDYTTAHCLEVYTYLPSFTVLGWVLGMCKL